MSILVCSLSATEDKCCVIQLPTISYVCISISKNRPIKVKVEVVEKNINDS